MISLSRLAGKFGLSYLRNENGKVKEFEDHDHGHGHEEEHGHDHNHSAAVTGANLYGADFVWKWAPDGNYKYSNLTLSAEYMLLDGVVDSKFKDDAESPDNLSAYYVSGVYRFNPSWSAVRYVTVKQKATMVMLTATICTSLH